jgi:pre-mRNA-splicing factor SYF1
MNNRVRADEIIRHCIRLYTDEVGSLWINLATYFLKLGQFGEVRDVYEEALGTITSARDFGIIFNAYMKFEE